MRSCGREGVTNTVHLHFWKDQAALFQKRIGLKSTDGTYSQHSNPGSLRMYVPCVAFLVPRNIEENNNGAQRPRRSCNCDSKTTVAETHRSEAPFTPNGWDQFAFQCECLALGGWVLAKLQSCAPTEHFRPEEWTLQMVMQQLSTPLEPWLLHSQHKALEARRQH